MIDLINGGADLICQILASFLEIQQTRICKITSFSVGQSFSKGKFMLWWGSQGENSNTQIGSIEVNSCFCSKRVMHVFQVAEI
ncbi:hypothetical protein QQP08_019649 [Theobroma cacao]|nr:hypothetical protein QQP08_019649 [Theobroma cacao]